MDNLPFATKVMPYRIEFFTCHGDFAEAIVLGKGVNDAVETLLRECKLIEGAWAIEKIELIRLQESQVAMINWK